MGIKGSKGWCMRALGAVSMAMLLAISACGGGGGGGAIPTPSPSPSNPNDPGPASLVPAAPALGQTLEADAGVLVPQTAGARWRFWGRQYGPAGNELARYESSYQLAASGAEWKLSGTNPGNDGPDSLRYVLAGGQLQQIEAVQFSAAQAPEEVRITLLRSPVRAGEQTLAYNKRIDGVADLDGDGRTESVDIAIYTRVTGLEKIDTALGEQLDAVRVETHLLQRVLYSKTGQVGPVVDIVGVDWFARGLGWVARDQPTLTSDGQVRIGKERLVGADVGLQGYGSPSAAAALMNPLSSPEQAGQPLAMQSPRAVSDGQRVLLVGSPPVIDYSGRPLLTLLDSRGEVQWTRLGPAGTRFAAPLGKGWVLWGNLDAGQVVVHRLDAQGQPLDAGPLTLDLGAPQTPLPSTHRSFVIGTDSQSLWVASTRTDWVVRSDGRLGTRDGIALRGFDVAGAPATAPLLLERNDVDGFYNGSFSLAVRQRQAQVAWLSSNGGLPHLMLAQVSATGAVTATQAAAGALSTTSLVALTATDNGVLMNWGFDGRYAWLDAAQTMTLLDATRSDGTLPPWPSNLLLQGADVARGDLLLRWGVDADVSSGAVNGTGGGALRWQLYRRGQAAPLRHSLVSSSVRGSDVQVVPLDDRMLIISLSTETSPPRWVVEQVRY